MIKIIADSVCDLSREICDELDITIIPLQVTMDGTTYDDGVDITKEEFFQRIKTMDGMPKTAAPAPAVYEDEFRKYMDGYDSIICYCMSGTASASYQNAVIAAKELNYKIDVVDTRTAGFGVGLNVFKGARMAKEGVEHEEIVRLSRDRVNRVRTLVILDTMEYLRRGGRISSTVAAMGSILRIKPIIQFMRSGTVGMLHRARGLNKGMEWLADYVVKNQRDLASQTTFIAYAENKATADSFLRILEKHTKLGEVIIGQIGSVVGSHVGSNGVGVFFEQDESYGDDF